MLSSVRVNPLHMLLCTASHCILHLCLVKQNPAPRKSCRFPPACAMPGVPHIPVGPGRASLVWLNQVTSITQGRGTAVVNGVYSPLDRHMSHPLASMGVTNAQQRKAPMCLMHIRKEQRGQFSSGVRACSSVMPCSRTQTQLSFNPAQWDSHQNKQTKNHFPPHIQKKEKKNCITSRVGGGVC